MMLQEFVSCGDCECVSCLKNHSCPKTSIMENPCIDCDGIPPYAPDAEERNLHQFSCDELYPTVKEEAPEFDIECPHCKAGYNWEDIDGKAKQVTPEDLASALNYAGLDGAGIAEGLEKIHGVTCHCEKKFVVGLVPDGSIDLETGKTDYAFFIISFS